MSSGNKIHQKSITALNNLLSEVQPIIDRHVEEMDSSVANYLLTNYSKYLKINLYADIEKQRTQSFSASPFDDLMDDYHDSNSKDTNK